MSFNSEKDILVPELRMTLSEIDWSKVTPGECEAIRRATTADLEAARDAFLEKTGGKNVSYKDGCTECGQICYTGGLCYTCSIGE